MCVYLETELGLWGDTSILVCPGLSWSALSLLHTGWLVIPCLLGVWYQDAQNSFSLRGFNRNQFPVSVSLTRCAPPQYICDLLTWLNKSRCQESKGFPSDPY